MDEAEAVARYVTVVMERERKKRAKVVHADKISTMLDGADFVGANSVGAEELEHVII